MTKEVLVVLTDKWCEWEASYATAVLNAYSEGMYEVKYIAVNKNEIVSMGGIRACADYDFGDYNNYENLAMVIMPGGLSWEENPYDEIYEFIKKVSEKNIPVAAICGASYYLCSRGFLNNVNHTGDSLELFKTGKCYTGEKFYQEKQVVVDKGFITANETAAVEFAYEIFKILKIDTEEEMKQWFENFQNGAIHQIK